MSKLRVEAFEEKRQFSAAIGCKCSDSNTCMHVVAETRKVAFAEQTIQRVVLGMLWSAKS